MQIKFSKSSTKITSRIRLNNLRLIFVVLVIKKIK